MKLKIYYMTFGCKVNQYETEHISELFAAKGCEKTSDLSAADVCVINSCTVTSQSDAKCRHFISRVRRENEECVIVLAGCFPQAFPDRAQKLSECDIIIGTKDKSKIPELVFDFIKSRKRSVNIKEHEKRSRFEPMCNSSAADKTRAYLKIQDGCDLFCSYCVIPFARGHICSKPLEDIKREVLMLVASGHKEIVLTGINICCYGRDLGGVRFIDAVECACSADGDYRVRLGSIEPEMLSDEDIERMSRLDKLCPQFHLSLQSGCDRTLKMMRRHYDTNEYLTLCGKLRKAFPGCAITTDIMVGFPQETEEDFEKSLAFAEKVGFASAHIFPYSRRSGTLADRMPGQIDRRTKALRAAKMTEICKKTALEYNRSFIGKTVEVLFERESCEEFHQGHIPEYVLVKTPKSYGTLWKQVRKVKITAAYHDHIVGEIVEEV
ncbi:MAG: tRNA (N(6)-L-threonylcarbamoyladenosine(37)-C(2))-methylthiotransferase MtaB [Oscillospiraceae bacterium]